MRKTKLNFRQLYFCRNCGKTFVDDEMAGKTYSPKIITNTLCAYNLGNTLEESANNTNRRFKVNISKSAVHSWLKEFSNICTYNKLRTDFLKDYGKNVLFEKTFEHNGLNYDFQYHIPKLESFCVNGFSGLGNYLKGFEAGCPDYFKKIEDRCSQVKINISVRKEGKYNNACRLAELALHACDRNKERHSVVENFMLINDSSTVACEVPVWLFEKNLNASICGHIDVLQIRNGRVYVLDFKPDAAFENVEKVASQLFFYASGLSFRTKIKLENFRCAWFDDNVYYEFSPKDAKVNFQMRN
ncbi:MAG: hypothetical protein ABIF85_01360 [Nanoarchaeota archaeon]|nr:hypothetical protein [Nanoarchaeota archaeon]MBU4300420.1 hypothetical protein [Nanoarchaeota archaeon]MBU4451540.1 hypothetical protein [Nanoarchaeota archaeon]MCG2724026.1 hypothetical protein [archaeon]